MLQLNAFVTTFFNEESEEFEERAGTLLLMEHSLLSLSKWEAFFEKPFLNNEVKTVEEQLWYYHSMICSGDASLEQLRGLTSSDQEKIQNYMNAKMTATWFSEHAPNNVSSETITSELIYFWMVSFRIPFECETWHLNRLLTLIRVCGAKNEAPKKMSQAEIMDRNRRLNEERRRQSGSTG